MNKIILIADDEEDIRELITFRLRSDGFDTITAENGMDAYSKIKQKKPDLIIADIMMPGMSGLELVKILKEKDDTKNIPIIIASARTEEDDIVLGLEAGADDYITKPFSLKVLSAKVKAQLRRRTVSEENRNIAGIIEMNKEKHQCFLKGEEILLSGTEYSLLFVMVQNPGRVFTRNQLINKIKGSDYPVTERSVDVQIVSLRKKLGSFGKENLKTVWGIGYKLEI